MAETLKPFDEADYLKTEEDMAGYLDAMAEEDDPQAMVTALGVVARARNTAHLARSIGVSREGLYKSFGADGNPSFSTVRKVAGALGYRLLFQRIAGSPAEARPAGNFGTDAEAAIDAADRLMGRAPRRSNKARDAKAK